PPPAATAAPAKPGEAGGGAGGRAGMRRDLRKRSGATAQDGAARADEAAPKLARKALEDSDKNEKAAEGKGSAEDAEVTLGEPAGLGVEVESRFLAPQDNFFGAIGAEAGGPAG